MNSSHSVFIRTYTRRCNQMVPEQTARASAIWTAVALKLEEQNIGFSYFCRATGSVFQSRVLPQPGAERPSASSSAGMTARCHLPPPSLQTGVSEPCCRSVSLAGCPVKTEESQVPGLKRLITRGCQERQIEHQCEITYFCSLSFGLMRIRSGEGKPVGDNPEPGGEPCLSCGWWGR